MAARKKIAAAHASIAELYMTDLWCVLNPRTPMGNLRQTGHAAAFIVMHRPVPHVYLAQRQFLVSWLMDSSLPPPLAYHHLSLLA